MVRCGDSYRMAGVKLILVAIVLQGFYLGSVCQEWTFPSSITALNGSCVEIPCIYDPAGRSRASSAVWYKYSVISYPEILNTKKKSSVEKEYKARTSLVPGENSCTLRIDPVRREDKGEYYPGIAEVRSTNAHTIQSRRLELDVTDSPEDIYLYVSGAIRGGESTTVRCSAYHTCGSSPPSIKWSKPGQIKNQSEEISAGSWREDSELTFIPSHIDNEIAIQCTATYPNGQKVVKSSTRIISYPPLNVTVKILGNDEAIEGSDVTLQCNSFSKPDVYEYEWYNGKNKTKLPDTRKNIRIKNMTRDTEPYSCIAINTMGTGESPLMEIPVLYPATGVHVTSMIKTDFAELSCDFLSCRPDVTHYTWMKDGSILQDETGKNLTIDNNVENNGRYSCIAHNSVGDSSSDEIYIKRDATNLPLILGAVAGIFFLLLLFLAIGFCIRKVYKSHFQASQKHTPPLRTLHHTTSVKEENYYGNIDNDQYAQPDSMRSMSSAEVHINEDYVIYCNNDVLQPTHDVEYSDISHVQDQISSTSRISHDHNVDYAMLRH